MKGSTAEEIFDIIDKNQYGTREEGINLIKEYARQQSEQMRNMIIEDHFKDHDPQIIKAVKSKKLSSNY